MATVLFVCTANRCRSPMAEKLMAAAFEKRDLDIDVASAGLLPSGSPVVAEVAQVMAEYGFDVSEHRSRRVTPQLIDSVDLVLCMERRHVREVVLQDRAAFAVTFTLREFLRRARLAPPDPDRPTPLSQWVRLLSAGRTTQSLMGKSNEDDIADPIGKSLAEFRNTARELASGTDSVAELLSDVVA